MASKTAATFILVYQFFMIIILTVEKGWKKAPALARVGKMAAHVAVGQPREPSRSAATAPVVYWSLDTPPFTPRRRYFAVSREPLLRRRRRNPPSHFIIIWTSFYCFSADNAAADEHAKILMYRVIQG